MLRQVREAIPEDVKNNPGQYETKVFIEPHQNESENSEGETLYDLNFIINKK